MFIFTSSFEPCQGKMCLWTCEKCTQIIMHMLKVTCGPRGYKTFSMLISAEHEIFSAYKYENATQLDLLSKKIAIVSNLRFISMKNFLLSWVEHEKSFITLGPGLCSSFIHTVVSNDSVSGQWMPWSDCTDAQANLGLVCLHIPKDTFYHGKTI